MIPPDAHGRRAHDDLRAGRHPADLGADDRGPLPHGPHQSEGVDGGHGGVVGRPAHAPEREALPLPVAGHDVEAGHLAQRQRDADRADLHRHDLVAPGARHVLPAPGDHDTRRQGECRPHLPLAWK
jgi:hypothetical protein